MPAPKDPKKYEEWKRNMSNSLKGKNRGEDNPFYGKSHSDEFKSKMSDIMSGSNNPFYGKSHSEQSRQKMSDYGKGKRKGEDNPFYGKSHSDETKNLISASRIGKYSGKDHPNYKDGSHISPYGREFTAGLKEQIRERDDHMCVLCGAKVADKSGNKLHVHHIDFSKDNHSLDNLISVCNVCHKDIHNGHVIVYSPTIWEENIH